MKLLISAYACAPNRGSDHAVGWNWATEAHRLGHEIWAFVSPAHHDSIKRACDEIPGLDGIHWVFPEVKGWPLKQAVEPKWERTYNVLWQRAALRAARDLGITTVGFTGNADSPMIGLCDLCLQVPSGATPLIQQIHIVAAHAICGIVEQALFGTA